MQLALHTEFLDHTELQTIPVAEPAVNMLVWKVAVIIVVVKLVMLLLFTVKHSRNRPL